jgi:hypothetical protein
VADVTPGKVQEYAEQAVAYVRRSLGMTLEFDSDTLPVLDHYLRSVPKDQSAATELIVVTSGAYFGEVVRRQLGGRWELNEDPKLWRVVLPAGLSFSPAGLAASAIMQAELADLDTAIDAPARMKTYVQQALERMGDVSEDAYYSLSGRLDTIEHLHEVLVTVAAQLLGETKGGDGGGEGEDGDEGADASDEADSDAPTGQHAEAPASAAGRGDDVPDVN